MQSILFQLRYFLCDRLISIHIMLNEANKSFLDLQNHAESQNI